MFCVCTHHYYLQTLWKLFPKDDAKSPPLIYNFAGLITTIANHDKDTNVSRVLAIYQALLWCLTGVVSVPRGTHR